VFTRPSPHRAGPEGNEDGALVLDLGDDRGLLAVADGVGGGPAGADAAEAALEALARHSAAGVERGDEIRGAVLDGIERAQEAVRALGGGAATTLAVVGLNGDHVRPYHVGDSEILLVGQRGKVKHRTLAHSPVAYAVESGLLEEVDALEHDERHLISNALGMPEIRIEVGPRLRMAPHDRLLLATDGLTDNLYLEEIVAAVRTGSPDRRVPDLAAAVGRRMARAESNSPGKPDDLTFVIWKRA
jgi:protein phosphatase